MWGFAAGMAAEIALGRFEKASHHVTHLPLGRTPHVPAGIDIETVPQLDPRLRRIKVHDDRSRGFAAGLTVDRSTWRDKSIRIYDPIPNPNQVHGNCTTCAKAMQLNAVGNRRTGVVLNMTWAEDAYLWETANDEFPGQMPDQDTGSSGLASCKTAQHTGDGGDYYWLFGGADEVVQSIMTGRAPSLGTWWDWGMFNPDADGVIHAGGGRAGGHQYVARRYWHSRDLVGIRCWWGDYRDVWMPRAELDDKIRDGGDGHFQFRA